MKCEHGKEVIVEVCPRSPICWDDGITTLDSTGRDTLFTVPGKEYLPISGCELCELIEVDIR